MNNFKYHEKKPPRVLSYPVRDPINMQAVRIMRPAAYYELPPPADNTSEIERLRKENMKLKESKVQTAALCKSLQKKVEASKKLLDEANDRLEQVIKDREDQIARLEGDDKIKAQKILNKHKAFLALCDCDRRGDSYEFVVVPDKHKKQNYTP